MEELLAPFRSPDIQVVLGVNLLLAWGFYLTVVTGQLSLGHSAFMAIGAYGASVLTVKLGIPFPLALVGGTAIACAAGILVGLPVLRLSGLYLAIATLGLVYIVTLILENWDFVGGRLGISGMQGTEVPLVWGIVLVVGAFLATFERSRLMLAMRSVRENPDAARAIGMNLTTLRVGGFAAGAALCGLGGGLWAHYIIFIDPYQFGLTKSFEIVLFVVLGGLGSFWGPVLGATVMTVLPVWVRVLKEWREVTFGILLIVMMGFRPQGIVSPEWVARIRRRRGKFRAPEGKVQSFSVLRRAAAGDGEVLLDVRDVSKSFGGVHAVSNVTLSARRGEILGIIGPNGAGKSTFFNCLTGFIPPDRGEVRYGGESLTGLPAHAIAQRGIRRTFQQGGVFRSFTVRDNVRAGQHAVVPVYRRSLLPFAWRRQERHSEARLHAILREVGLAEHALDMAGSLAYGDQRRLEIARALAGDPELLLLDEPAAGMNQTEANELADLLRRLRALGLTIVLIEHNMALVMSLCDRLLVLDYGIVIAEGTPDEVARNPAVIEAYLGEEH
ncbi:MAG: ATP-binding cassette domain-containing protein [Alphaproteobacteria bacterium]